MDTLKQNIAIYLHLNSEHPLFKGRDYTVESLVSRFEPTVDNSCTFGYLRLPNSTLSGSIFHPFPRYTNDLNAMHEAEQKLLDKECYKYNTELIKVKHGPQTAETPNQKWTWGTSAAQRAEAFLRVIGKWEESEP